MGAVVHNATQGATALQGAVSGGAPLADAAQTGLAGAQATAPVAGVFTWGGYFQAIGVMFLLLALLWFAVWMIRKYGKFNFLPQPGDLPRDALFVETQLPLGPRRGLVVVRFLDKRLLLGITDSQITLLQEVAHTHGRDDTEFTKVLDKAERDISTAE